MPEINDGVLIAGITVIGTLSVGMIGSIGVLVGHWATRATDKEASTLSMLKVTIGELRAEVERLTKKVDALERRTHVLGAAYRSALAYAEELRDALRAALLSIPAGVSRPNVPDPPEDIADDLV
ncbi:hypothetical protein [Schaalia sp. ZJ1691]|uniref:hypothetical protein n=1 Tax=Schaalia sp. ZJ1691 TaxID=2709404 RepID=UPI0013EB8049|nr:hypothetical protein [Schaalia sp. ZJ1691]